ncbi:Holliday junction branch migration DNA helicase RuvB [Candidatus Saccharibacteria bacterium]|nr:Holliday junction branch migration DNA helicase RuvB [Candidatus Saccharibacteria bacterium]
MAIERSTERVVDVKSHEEPEEEVFEKSLRPTTFSEYIGQERLKTNLKLAIDAVKKRNDGTTLDHVLLYGPPGLGKTTMANVIAHELAANLKVTSGPAIERAGDLASILTNLQDGDVLFIDEIHRLRRVVEEILYSAMEDYKLDIVIGKGPAARSVRLDLPHFTVIGATTRTGALAGPLRDRFGIIHRLEYYKLPEIQQIVSRTANILGKEISLEATELLATRCRLTPRIANRLVKRVRDYSDVNGDGIIDLATTQKALDLMEIDEFGLDPADRNMLELMIENYGDRPVGLTTIAALTGDEATTIEEYYEPYLLQLGLLERTPKGRVVTPKAREHLEKVKRFALTRFKPWQK